MRCILILLTFNLAMAWSLPAADRFFAPKPVPGAINHFEVYYLDGARLTGDDGLRKDHQLTVDIAIPKGGKKKHPCIITVHGGGFGEGDKNGENSDITIAGVKSGFVMVDANYILKPRMLMPQVIYDIRDLVRFLRKNAEQYAIDPDAIGLIGYSAGGWLITSAWIPNGDYIGNEIRGGKPYLKHIEIEDRNARRRKSSIERGKPWEAEIKIKYNKRNSQSHPTASHFLRNPNPHYPGISASVQAISQDFGWYGDQLTVVSELPAHNTWCGLSKEGKPRPQLGYLADKDVWICTSQITPEKYWGKGVHCPNEKTEALAYDNVTKVKLYERHIEYFKQHLVTQRRVPNPEIHPGMRVVDGPTEITILTTSDNIKVFYTLDGSKPSASSTPYMKPFTVDPGTTIKAIATRGEEKPSQVVTATFYKGTPPPIITGPDVDELPLATVGNSYQVQFTADTAADHWYLSGDFGRTKDGKGVNNLTIDEKGLLSGRPKHGGRYWLQVGVAEDELGIATVRNYRLVIAGPEGPPPAAFSSEDRNVDFATAPSSYTQEDIDAILKPLTDANIAVHVNKTADGWHMVVDRHLFKTAKEIIIWPIRFKKVKPLTFSEEPRIK